jgi:hypothetical protein
MMNRKIIIVILTGSFFIHGCSAPKTAVDHRYTSYAKKDSLLIKEMAEYALLFSIENNTRSFEADHIADKKIRRKMSSLGNTVDISYYSSMDITDSSVVFKSITLGGVKEYIYDFSTRPKMLGSDTAGSRQPTIQVTQRIYYRRRPFPMM